MLQLKLAPQHLFHRCWVVKNHENLDTAIDCYVFPSQYPEKFVIFAWRRNITVLMTTLWDALLSRYQELVSGIQSSTSVVLLNVQIRYRPNPSNPNSQLHT